MVWMTIGMSSWSGLPACSPGLVMVWDGGAGWIPGGSTPPPRERATEWLRAMSSRELWTRYRLGVATPLPVGRVKGVALPCPDARFGELISRSAGVVWQGKIATEGSNLLLNRFFGVRSVPGRMFWGTSRVDGLPCLLVDYSQTSWVYANVRDELRMIAPGVYLGPMFRKQRDGSERFEMFFALIAP